MRAFFAAAIFCVLFSIAPAQARPHYGHYTGLSSPCQQARALGGPCGCVASEHVFGHSVRGLWSVSAWYQFPRVAPAAGTVAIWRGRHVEAVVSVDGNVATTNGPYGVRHIDLAHSHLTFVDPHGRQFAPDKTPTRYAAHHATHHVRYASHHQHHDWTRVAEFKPHGFMGF
jgi:hypothetical protein